MSELFNAATEPALITGVASVLTGVTASIMTLIITDRKSRHDSKLEEAAEKVARELLGDKAWTLRSLTVFKLRLPGIADDELRRILIRSGAISINIDGEEAWGLVSRNKQLLNLDKLDGPLEKRSVIVKIEPKMQQQQQQQVQQQQRQQQEQLPSREQMQEVVKRKINECLAEEISTLFGGMYEGMYFDVS